MIIDVSTAKSGINHRYSYSLGAAMGPMLSTPEERDTNKTYQLFNSIVPKSFPKANPYQIVGYGGSVPAMLDYKFGQRNAFAFTAGGIIEGSSTHQLAIQNNNTNEVSYEHHVFLSAAAFFGFKMAFGVKRNSWVGRFAGCGISCIFMIIHAK